MRYLVVLLMFIGLPVQACQMALMFGVDASGSINSDEWQLQTGGLADALLEPEIAQIIVGQQAYLSAFQWSSAAEQEFSQPWQRITDQSALASFAAQIRARPRRWSEGHTAIGSAMIKMGAEFAPVAQCRRRVIDLSGDGTQNDGDNLEGARGLLSALGVTLNGLAIEPWNKMEVAGFKSLDIYYRTRVIVGRGAFVQAADGYRDYPRAIRLKLIKELTQPLS